jgi:hypothetical protein
MVHNLLEAGMAKAEAGPDIATMSFEDALRELEQIVHRLEAGDVPLDSKGGRRDFNLVNFVDPELRLGSSCCG